MRESGWLWAASTEGWRGREDASGRLLLLARGGEGKLRGGEPGAAPPGRQAGNGGCRGAAAGSLSPEASVSWGPRANQHGEALTCGMLRCPRPRLAWPRDIVAAAGPRRRSQHRCGTKLAAGARARG